MLSTSHLHTLASRVANTSRPFVYRRCLHYSKNRNALLAKRKLSSSSTSGNPTSKPPVSSGGAKPQSPPTTSDTGGGAIGPFAQRQKKAEARAKQLHEEIETIYKKHDYKHEAEVKKAKSWRGFIDFLSNNKTNLSIIVVSFLTVVLSIKLVQAKQDCRKIEKELKGTEDTLTENRQLLKTIISEEYLSKIAKKCETALIANKTPMGGSGWFGRSASTSGQRSHADTERVLSQVLSKEVNTLIGNAALSDDEKDAKEIDDLQHSSSGGDSESAAIEKLSTLSENSGSQEQPVEELEWVVDANGKKIASKKSVFVI